METETFGPAGCPDHICCSGFCLLGFSSGKILRIGVYAGSSWDVPTSQRSHALDLAIQKFEKSHPNVRVEYENGIPQSEYSNWLSEKIVSGKTPDVFMVSEKDCPYWRHVAF